MTNGRRTVLVGIVDDGIAFAHERFRTRATGRPEKARVEYMWVQDGEIETPSSVPYGREIRKETQVGKPGIDDLIAACTHAGVLDEDELYLRAGLFDFRRRDVFHKAATWRAAHGTHVMHLACGFDPKENRSDRPIVCVQLPAGATADTSGATLIPHAINAIQYIFDRALMVAQSRNEPNFDVVINFSYGTISGPHDGTSELELALDEKAQRHRLLYGVNVEVVLPAGNNHLSRCHAEVALTNVQPKALEWRVQPDDQTDSVVEFWLPHRLDPKGPSRLTLTIMAPNRESRTIIEKDGEVKHWGSVANAYAEVRCLHFKAPTERTRFRIKINPTASLLRDAPIAPPGIWTITFKKAKKPRSLTVQAWVQRDESLYGYPRRGRQSFFDDKDYRRLDNAGREIEIDEGPSLVKRERLLNGIATGARTSANGVDTQTIVMGGFFRKKDVLAPYSAGGPTTPPRGTNINRLGPDAVTPSEDSKVHRGILAAGSRSGSVVAMGGTSVAAPQIARWIAEQRAEQKPGNVDAVREFARASDKRPNPPDPKRGGEGRIDLPPVVPLRRF